MSSFSDATRNRQKGPSLFDFLLLPPLSYPFPKNTMTSSSSPTYLTSILLLSSTLLTLGAPLQPQPLSTFDPRAAAISDSLKDCLSSTNAELSYPGDDSYSDLTISENAIYHNQPALFALPENSQQASEVVKCVAEDGNIKFTPRSGGHSYTGESTRKRRWNFKAQSSL